MSSSTKSRQKAMYRVCSVLVLSLATCSAALAATDNGTTTQPGLLIVNKPGSWYSLKVSNPVVLQLGPRDYRMWAYGRDVNYTGSTTVSFGRTGYFASKDGITWTPVTGPSELGSVMSGNRSCGTACFDSGEVGVTDVIASPSQGVFYQWYMGVRQTPNSDKPAFGAIPATRGGVAVSYDGLHWATCRGPKSYGSWLEATPGVDGFMFLMTLNKLSSPKRAAGQTKATSAARQSPNADGDAAPGPGGGSLGENADWGIGHRGRDRGQVPDCDKLVREAQMSSRQPCKRGKLPCVIVAGEKYHMFYNSIAPINGSTTNPVPVYKLHVQLFGATGINIFEFKKTGAVQSLAPSLANPLALDSLSTGSARALALPQGGYLLFFEAMNATSLRYSIGLARSADGLNWQKDTTCTGQPGGPVLLPGDKESSWDWYIGTPQPLLQPDGRIFLYYVGFYKPDLSKGEGAARSQIGLAVGHVSNPCKFVKYVYVT